MPVDVGVVQQFLHPPLGLLAPHLDTTGPYTGVVTLTSFGTHPVADTYGAVFALSGAIPAELGYELGWSNLSDLFTGNTYTDRLFQVVVQHQLLGGAWITSQLIESHQLATLVLWDVALPGRVGLCILPGVALDVLYLLVG